MIQTQARTDTRAGSPGRGRCFPPGISSLRSAAHSARIHAPYRGEAARNPQMTRGIFLARSAAGRDFPRTVAPPVWNCAAPADGNAASPTRRRGRRSGAGGDQ